MGDLEESRLNQLQIEVYSLKEKVSFFNVIYNKFDATLEKLQEMIEDRREDTHDELKDVYKKIEDTENKIMEQIASLRDHMTRQHEEEKKKLINLDKWRWILVGAAAVVSWIIAKIKIPFDV
jgi:DNA repair exonuclease SbcCD ATPase subunit